MNVAEALNNACASGFLLGPVTVREAGNRVQEDSKFKAGMKNWKQKIRVADSTGDTDVYLTDQPLVTVGQTIEISGASTAKSGKYCSGNYKAVVKSVGVIQRGPEPSIVAQDQTILQGKVSVAPDCAETAVMDPLGNMGRLFAKCKLAAESEVGERYVVETSLPEGVDISAQKAVNDRIFQLGISFLIGMQRR